MTRRRKRMMAVRKSSKKWNRRMKKRIGSFSITPLSKLAMDSCRRNANPRKDTNSKRIRTKTMKRVIGNYPRSRTKKMNRSKIIIRSSCSLRTSPNRASRRRSKNPRRISRTRTRTKKMKMKRILMRMR